jgi:hypothetical protein
VLRIKLSGQPRPPGAAVLDRQLAYSHVPAALKLLSPEALKLVLAKDDQQ